MAQFIESMFEGTTVVLDGHEYSKCKFLRCRVIVTRGNFSLRDCAFDGCTFEFGGEAENIRNLVLGLLHQPAPTPSMSQGGI
jgi:hypothetical protein